MELICINPTKTLTKGEKYKGALLSVGKSSYLHTTSLKDAALFVVFNSDNGKRLSCKANRFIEDNNLN